MYMAAGLMALTAMGCTDLDVDVKSYYTSYPESDVALDAKMSNVYYCFRGALGRRYGEAASLSSDEEVGISFGSSYFDSGTYANSTLHTYSPDDASIGWYGDLASGIVFANDAIVDMGSDSEAAAYARAMRAFYHFLLMDSYGDIPILDHKVAEGEMIERQPRADVARFIESELLDIIPKLTDEVSAVTYGKPTKWMAEALLVKLYINWPVYTANDVTAYNAANYSNEKLNDLVALCDDIIQSGNFSLEGGEQAGDGSTPANRFLAKFYPNNGPQIKDFIYAMPYDALSAQGFQYGRPRIWRLGQNDGQGGPSYFGTTISQSVGGNFSVSPECAQRFIDAYKEGDLRGESLIGVPDGHIYMYDPITYNKTNTYYKYNGEEVILTQTITLDETSSYPLSTGADKTQPAINQGFKSIKYFVVDEDFKNGRNQSNDLPIFRYADILLMKAEAILRGATATNGQTALSLVNEVRSYAKAPAKSTVDLAVLLNERGLEFFDENWRRNDMIRFGTFEDEYGYHTKAMEAKGLASFDKTKRILPIPTGILNENTNWKQNAGY